MNTKISRISTGPYELVESGTVQVLSKEITTIFFDTISIKFEFESDDKSTESVIRVDTTGTNTIKFILVNINNPTYGTTDFVQFAKIDGANVYISFRVNSLNDKNVRSIEYSIFNKNV